MTHHQSIPFFGQTYYEIAVFHTFENKEQKKNLFVEIVLQQFKTDTMER